MNELAWPFPQFHYIGLANGTGYCHSDGDAVTTLRGLLEIDGDGPINEADVEAIKNWHILHGHQPLTVVRAKDWLRMVRERELESGTPPVAEAAPVASFSGAVRVSSDSTIGEVVEEPAEIPYEQMGYRDLQAEARERGLPSGGTHVELIDRLRADDAG